MWRCSLLDVRVRRGADASSDHHLVTDKVTLKLRAAADQIYTPPLDMTSADYKTLGQKCLCSTAEEQVPSLE